MDKELPKISDRFILKHKLGQGTFSKYKIIIVNLRKPQIILYLHSVPPYNNLFDFPASTHYPIFDTPISFKIPPTPALRLISIDGAVLAFFGSELKSKYDF